MCVCVVGGDMIIFFTIKPWSTYLEEENNLGEMQLYWGRSHKYYKNTYLVPSMQGPYVKSETWSLPSKNLYFSLGIWDICMWKS